MPLKNPGQSSRKKHSIQEKRRGCEGGKCLVMRQTKLSRLLSASHVEFELRMIVPKLKKLFVLQS